MITLEIVDNANCPAMDLRIFHDVEPPQPAAQVRLSRDGQSSQWYSVTGWSQAGGPCPAWVQKIDDSGDGVAFLLYGGDAGLRLCPTTSHEPWASSNPQQWGEPFLIIGDREDIR